MDPYPANLGRQRNPGGLASNVKCIINKSIVVIIIVIIIIIIIIITVIVIIIKFLA